MDRFILLAGRRSGTTLLLKSLDSHPEIQCCKEVFSTKKRFHFFQVDKPSSPFYKFRSASKRRQINYVFRRKQLIDAFLTELYATIDNPKAAIVRVAYTQADKYPEILEWAIENKVGVIHLVRDNSLKTVVSLFTSQKRGIYHSTSKIEQITIRVSPRTLKRRVAALTKQIKKYRTILKEQRHCEVSYESFVANRDAETRRILDFLHIDQFIPLTTDLIKLNPDSVVDILENYEEVAQAFKDTVFEKYLVM